MKKQGIIIAVALVVVVLVIVMFSRARRFSGRVAGGSASVSAQELYDQARVYRERNELLKAQKAYQQLMASRPDFKDIATVQKHLEEANIAIIFSSLPVPQSVIHEVQKGDTLGKIARQYNVTVELIKKSNNLVSDVIRLGQRLRIWTGVFSAYVNKSQNILILRSDNDIVKVYPVATGKDNITPVGTFIIEEKLENPVWFKSGAIIPPDSPENILGTRWLGFDLPSYGIHGTTDDSSIGGQATAGCIRMYNHDVEELYSLLPRGTQVTIVD